MRKEERKERRDGRKEKRKKGTGRKAEGKRGEEERKRGRGEEETELVIHGSHMVSGTRCPAHSDLAPVFYRTSAFWGRCPKRKKRGRDWEKKKKESEEKGKSKGR